MSDSYVGQLLVASARIEDPLFGRSVCLVMQHDASGAIGVLLNRPLQVGPQLWQLLGSDQEQKSRLESAGENRWVHFGGPLSGPVVALHVNRQLADAETLPGVYVAAQKEHLQQLVKEVQPETRMRLIVGHAGWPEGQLEAEIAAGLWHVLPATVDRVFEADEAMWPHLVKQGVGLSLAKWVGIEDHQIEAQWN